MYVNYIILIRYKMLRKRNLHMSLALGLERASGSSYALAMSCIYSDGNGAYVSIILQEIASREHRTRTLTPQH